MKGIHDLIVDELFSNKSIAAFIYLINMGREIEISYNDTSAFISKDGSAKQCSVWIDENEQAFDCMEELLQSALIQNQKLVDVWKQIEIKTLF